MATSPFDEEQETGATTPFDEDNVATPQNTDTYSDAPAYSPGANSGKIDNFP